MAKEHLYAPEAERLYVTEQSPLSEIAARMPVSERALRLWKDKYRWDEKRQAYLNSRRAFHEELYDFGQHLLRKIREDEEAGVPVAPHRYHALMSICPNLTRIRDYEEVARQQDAKAKKGASQKDAVTAVRQALGIDDDTGPGDETAGQE
ncbi:MAG: hypothetical protein JW699_02910 [Chitinispirillaceae bacterium]|nr:hypothetical protein [Chitinispirillaceae bacterium]